MPTVQERLHRLGRKLTRAYCDKPAAAGPVVRVEVCEEGQGHYGHEYGYKPCPGGDLELQSQALGNAARSKTSGTGLVRMDESIDNCDQFLARYKLALPTVPPGMFAKTYGKYPQGSDIPVVELSRDEQPVMLRSDKIMTFSSTLHQATFKHILKPACKRNSVEYDVSSRFIVTGGQRLCFVNVVSMSHGVGAAMRQFFAYPPHVQPTASTSSNQRPQSNAHMKAAMENFAFAFTKSCVAALESGCTCFVVTDYATTAMFQLKQQPDGDALVKLRQNCGDNSVGAFITRHVPVDVTLVQAEHHPVVDAMDRFVKQSVAAAAAASSLSNRALCLNYHNCLTRGEAIVPSLPEASGIDDNGNEDTTLPVVKLKRRQLTTPVQTGYGCYSQTFILRNGGKFGVRDVNRCFLKVFDDRFYDIRCTVPAKRLFEAEVAAYNMLTEIQGTVVPKVYSYGALQSSAVRGWYILMEYLPDLNNSNNNNNNNSVDGHGQAQRALQQVHEHGVAHGDIHPHNIKHASDGTVRIIDFALSRSKTRPSYHHEHAPSLTTMPSLSHTLSSSSSSSSSSSTTWTLGSLTPDTTTTTDLTAESMAAAGDSSDVVDSAWSQAAKQDITNLQTLFIA